MYWHALHPAVRRYLGQLLNDEEAIASMRKGIAVLQRHVAQLVSTVQHPTQGCAKHANRSVSLASTIAPCWDASMPLTVLHPIYKSRSAPVTKIDLILGRG